MQNALESVRQFHAVMNAPISQKPTLLAYVRKTAAAVAERIGTLATETITIAPVEYVLLRRASMALEELAEWIADHAYGDLVTAADA